MQCDPKSIIPFHFPVIEKVDILSDLLSIITKPNWKVLPSIFELFSPYISSNILTVVWQFRSLKPEHGFSKRNHSYYYIQAIKRSSSKITKWNYKFWISLKASIDPWVLMDMKVQIKTGNKSPKVKRQFHLRIEKKSPQKEWKLTSFF